MFKSPLCKKFLTDLQTRPTTALSPVTPILFNHIIFAKACQVDAVTKEHKK